MIIKRSRFCRQKLIEDADWTFNTLLCVVECALTAGPTKGKEHIARHPDETWYDDCTFDKYNYRPGLTIWRRIGMSSRGRCYIFHPESKIEREAVIHAIEEELQPEFDKRYAEWQDEHREEDFLYCLKHGLEGCGIWGLTPKERKAVLPGNEPRPPKLHQVGMTLDPDDTGLDWWRYTEVVKPILLGECERFKRYIGC